MIVVLGVYLAFGLYVITMALYGVHLRGRMSWAGYLLGWPWVLVAYVADVTLQYTLASVVFRELPPRGEWTVSRRLSRWKRDDPLSRRGVWAAKTCRFLSVFDPKGDHC